MAKWLRLLESNHTPQSYTTPKLLNYCANYVILTQFIQALLAYATHYGIVSQITYSVATIGCIVYALHKNRLLLQYGLIAHCIIGSGFSMGYKESTPFATILYIVQNYPVQIYLLIFVVRRIAYISLILVAYCFGLGLLVLGCSIYSFEVLGTYYLATMFIISIFIFEQNSHYKQFTEYESAANAWKHTLDMSPVGFLIMDKFNNTLIYNNQQTEELLKECKNSQYNEAIQMLQKIARPISSGIKEVESKIINFDTKQLEWREQFLVVNKNLSKLHLFIDVTSAKNIKEEKCNRKYVEMLVATSTHELRTPLNGIKSYITLAKDYCSPQGVEFIDRCLSCCELQEALINDIMDFAKLQENKIKLNISSFEVSKVIQECKDIIEMQSKDKGLTLIVLIDKNLPKIFYSDERRVKQIVLNLLSNSLKFTHKGGSITISVKYRSGNLKIIVADTGIGISEDNIKNLFKPFGILESSENINKTGTGLGLHLCKNLCNLLGGDIKAKSVFGKSSHFSFFITNQKPAAEKVKSTKLDCIKSRSYKFN